MQKQDQHLQNRRSFLKTMGAGAIGAAGASLLPTSGAAAQKKPNVLFLAIDDLNDWVGCYGGHPQALTPNIDQLASEGMLFENAECQAPICTPSRASLLTGIYPSTSGLYFLGPQMRKSETLRDAVSMQQYFMEHGYKSLGAGKIFHGGKDAPSFHEYGGSMGSFGPRPKEKLSCPKGHPLWDWGAFPDTDAEMPDYKIAQWAKGKLAEEHEEPFFLSVGFYRPHVPMYAPQKWFDKHPLDKVVLPEASKEDLEDVPKYALDLTWGEAAPRHDYVVEIGEWEHAVQSYLASVSFVDNCVGEVLSALKSSKYANNTIIVLWGDHGFHLGEKCRWGKRSLWEESTRAPLIIAGPGIEGGQRCAKPVGMIDLYPTLVDLCGLPDKKELEGQSITPLLENPKASWERPARTTFGPGNHSLRSEQYRYIHYNDGSEELYDHAVDPGEKTNLASDEKYKSIIEEFKKWLPAKERELLPGSSGSDSPLYGPLPKYDPAE